MSKDLDLFHNKLRTKQFFARENQKCQNTKRVTNQTVTQNTGLCPYSDTMSLYKLKTKSNWKAPIGSPALETFINLNEIKLNHQKPKIIKDQNITEGERRSLKKLAKDPTITIKPADKGGAIVILNTKDYVTEAHRQLNDTNTYKQLDIDPTSKFETIVNTQIDEMVTNNEITPKVAGILKIKKPKTPQIYFLPKIHKDVVPPPGRPIVSANSCPTENISAFIDMFLNPLVKNSDHYIKDTTDFVRKIKEIGKVEPNTILGSLDVSSLYTNIPNNEGLNATLNILQSERYGPHRPKNETLIKLLELVLSKNNFQFNGQNYLQVGGTAMGTRVVPSYANLFMRKLESKLLDKSELKPTIWLRYIDDIFFIWKHGEAALHKWVKYLNSAHDTIKFTMEFSSKEINFLDTLVKIDNTHNLYTTLYTKPTDSHSYLRYNSAHPPHCKNSLPYSQLLRLKRICTKEEDLVTHARKLNGDFIKRGYPQKLLQNSMKKCSKITREELLSTYQKTNKNDNNEEEKTFFVQTFRPCKNSLTQTIRDNWNILGRSKSTKEIHRSRLVTSFKKPKSIRDYLVKARTDYHPDDNGQQPSSENNKNKCTKPHCKYCKN